MGGKKRGEGEKREREKRREGGKVTGRRSAS